MSDWFITAPWEEVRRSNHFATDCQHVGTARPGHFFMFYGRDFLIQVRYSQHTDSMTLGAGF